MTELEVLLIDTVKSALRCREFRLAWQRAGPLTEKQARARLLREERFFNQSAARALARVDEIITGRGGTCCSSGGGKR